MCFYNVFQPFTGLFAGMNVVYISLVHLTSFHRKIAMKKLNKIIRASNDDTIVTARFNPVRQLYRWIIINRVTSKLERLDDRILDDIGIVRGDIRAHAERVILKKQQPAA
jgi:uncharacterized protein YjiS (DUF1127 family)